MTQVAIEFGIDLEPKRRDSPFVYSLYTANPVVKNLISPYTPFKPISTLSVSEHSCVEEIYTKDRLHMVTKIDFPVPMNSNEEPRNRVEDQFKLLQILEGTGSFALPYGIGQAVNIDTKKTHNALFLEYVQGVPLGVALHNRRDPSPEYVLWFNLISAKLCDAVSSLQNASIVHRDLSGNNILIDNSDLKIIDVDIAKILTGDEGHVDAGYLSISTPAIAPPEAYKNIYSKKTDIYTVGLHHLAWLTGITDPEKLCNMVSEIHEGKINISYDPCLVHVLHYQTLEEFKHIILPLVARDYHERPDNLFDFRRKFTRILFPHQQLIYARTH